MSLLNFFLKIDLKGKKQLEKMSVGRRETSADLIHGSGLWLSGGALAWVVCKPWFVPSMAGGMKQICCMRDKTEKLIQREY